MMILAVCVWGVVVVAASADLEGMCGVPSSSLSRLLVYCTPKKLLAAASLSKACTNQPPEGRTLRGANLCLCLALSGLFKTLVTSPHPSFLLPLLIPPSVNLRFYAISGHC